MCCWTPLVNRLSLFEVFGLSSGVFIAKRVFWDWSKTRPSNMVLKTKQTHTHKKKPQPYCIKWESSLLGHILRAATETWSILLSWNTYTVTLFSLLAMLLNLNFLCPLLLSHHKVSELNIVQTGLHEQHTMLWMFFYPGWGFAASEMTYIGGNEPLDHLAPVLKDGYLFDRTNRPYCCMFRIKI